MAVRAHAPYTLIAVFLVGVAVGILVTQMMKRTEGFQGTASVPKTGPGTCTICGTLSCPPMPDLSKYVLKSSIPPPVKCPDMKDYMLKTECPPVPDLSQYVLKSSIPNPEPIIIDNSSCKDGQGGECPPCPRPRCPEVKCPPPTVCPACPPCECKPCPEPNVQCRNTAPPAASSSVRPYLAPLNFGVFGGN